MATILCIDDDPGILELHNAILGALDRLERRKIVRIEEDEAFFKDNEARDARYEVKNLVPSSYVRPRRRKRSYSYTNDDKSRPERSFTRKRNSAVLT